MVCYGLLHELPLKNINFLALLQKQADRLWIEKREIEKGILQLITKYKIGRLIMGAAAEAFTPKYACVMSILYDCDCFLDLDCFLYPEVCV